MKVREITQNILILEYRQEKGDEDYGSCLWARFCFNLDKYELFIMSDCGDYSYGWCPTPDSESFLELMARINEDYLLHKLCGEPKYFDYDATKEHFYEYTDDDEDREKLDEIFDEIENEYIPESGETFIRMFDEYNVDEHNHVIFYDAWEMPVYVYTAHQKRICRIFRDCIQPRIREIVKEEKHEMQ